MGPNKIAFLICGGLILLVGVLYFFYDKKTLEYESRVSDSVTIEQTWELPDELKEVSGIAFLDTQRLVSVQDEEGILFIYNLNTSEIERQIEFAAPGDYEGVAVKGNTAYVLGAEGKIYVVNNFQEEADVQEYQTSFTSENDMESLFLDEQNNRLLLAPKERDPNSKDFKGIYAFNLNTMEVEESPVFELTFEEPVFDEIRENNAQNTFFPSEVALDPQNNLYVLEGRNPRLIVLDASGNAKAMHVLDKEQFPQPEGLAFSKDGKLYISNEGEPGTIHQVVIK